MDLEKIRLLLSDRNLKIVAQRTGVSYMTVYGIARGTNANPSIKTFNKLANYLGAQDGR